MADVFRRFAQACANAVGSSWAFLIAGLVVVVWGLTGPLFHYSDTWQLVINTGTSVVTFLMVFIIQSSQNRDAKAMQLKLDELLRAIASARNSLVDLENLKDEDLARLQKEFHRISQRGNAPKARSGQDQTRAPE